MMRRVLLVITGIVLGYFMGSWLAQQYYVTRSIEYGYLPKTKEESMKSYVSSLEDFGPRASDLVALLREIKNPSAVLGATDTGVYTIAVIGDSYVFGQGIREEERFTRLLEQKLNTIRPTKIVTLGFGGDSIVDNYIKYTRYAQNHHLDMTIIGVVDNDLLFRYKNNYDQSIQDQLLQQCDKPMIFETQGVKERYEPLKEQSYLESNGNLCVLRAILDKLPKNNNILFFNFGDNWGTPEQIDILVNEIQTHGFPVVSTPYMKDGPRFYVSKEDGHPSAYANMLFSETLFNTITDTWNGK